MFESLCWNGDSLELNGWRFCLDGRSEELNTRDDIDAFWLYKDKKIYDEYEQIFSAYSQFSAQNILELGVWKGASLAIWNELFKPARIVGVDVLTQFSLTPYLCSYLEKNNQSESIKIYWGVNQSDTRVLEEICEKEFSAPIDLIIDDASHFYEESKISFEFLFPKLRTGGLYIIEDWSWFYWEEYDEHPYFDGRPGLSNLVMEIMEMIGSSRSTTPAKLTILPTLVAVEKLDMDVDANEPFSLERLIRRRPYRSAPSPVRKLG